MKIHQIKNIFPDIRVARFNLAAWQKIGSDSIYFIGNRQYVNFSAGADIIKLVFSLMIYKIVNDSDKIIYIGVVKKNILIDVDW